MVWISTEEGVTEADQIALVVYGEETNTGPIVVWTGKENGMFQAGNIDDFKVGTSFIKFMCRLLRL